MKKTVTMLLLECNNNTNDMKELIERFEPLINSYSKKSGWKIETEDMKSILIIKLITLAKEMQVSDYEGENVKFIAVCLKNHFLDVIRKINRLESNEERLRDISEDVTTIDEEDLIFEDLIKGLNEQKQEIIRLKFKEMYTDKEIAQKLNVSRQSINKQLRGIYKQLTTTAETSLR